MIERGDWLRRITVTVEPFGGYQQVSAYRFRQEENEPGEPVTLMAPRSLMAPPGIPDFFTRSGVTLYGRFDPAKDRQFVMRMTGWAGDRKKEVVFRAELDKAGKGGSSIPGNWAFAKSSALFRMIPPQIPMP